MFPLHDDNPALRRPLVTIVLLVVTVGAWFFVQGAGTDVALSRSVCELGVIPGEITGKAVEHMVQISPTAACQLVEQPNFATLLTSMFMHGGWFHLLGNMWFLWVFGNNVEDVMGRLRFPVFYVLCGLAAAAAQIVVNPASPIPMVGASGAISGVMGAYIVLFPRVSVTLLVFLGFFITTLRVPAFLMLAYWFLLQVMGGLPQLGDVGSGVAFWAHAGGFVAGALLVFVFKNPELVEKHRRLGGSAPARRSRWR